jgi:hypothetical protein
MNRLGVIARDKKALPRKLLSGELRLPSQMLRRAGVPAAFHKLEASA